METRFTVGYPSAWRAYSGYVSDLPGKAWKEDLHTSMSRFANRYRAASSVEISFGFDTSASRGYADLLKLAMAYSTLEALEGALKADPSIASLSSKKSRERYLRVKINSQELADLYRGFESTKLRKALQQHLSRRELKDRLSELSGRGADVRPLVQGIRHLAFHGLVAPGTIAYEWRENGEVQQLLRGLHGLTLLAVDTHFTKWVTDFCRPKDALF